MERIRIQRLEKELLKFINNIVTYTLRDKNLEWVSISAVKLTNDISHAKIYFTFLGEKSPQNVLDTLTKSSGFIKKEIAAAKFLRQIPELIFLHDDLENNARNIDKIFAKIHAEKEK